MFNERKWYRILLWGCLSISKQYERDYQSVKTREYQVWFMWTEIQFRFVKVCWFGQWSYINLRLRSWVQAPPMPKINKAAQSGYETQRRYHQKSKTGDQWPHKKDLDMSSKIKKNCLPELKEEQLASDTSRVTKRVENKSLENCQSKIM